ncbi:hypothetical protein [Paraconexibacter sp. AEG42_29]|uniref:hypothetical protein n=1 Tax=Paraconexibacter sp. AEG42_29 TaxID=2997339 RepID=UPI00339D52D3
MEDDEIRALVGRLSRRHASGGRAIARAAIMAEGEDATAVIDWILAHDGQPETGASAGPAAGLHRRRVTDAAASAARPPVRYVLPASAFGA